MNMLLVIGALAAQTASSPPPPSPTPQSPSAASAAPKRGQSTYVDLEAGVGYATNPLLRFGDSTGSGFGRLSVQAVHARSSDRTTAFLSAFGQTHFYTRRYGAQQSLGLSGSLTNRASEKLTIFGGASFSYDKGGQLATQIFGVPELVVIPGIPDPVVVSPGQTDFLSVTGRTYSANANVGARYTLSAREFISATTGITHVIFKGGALDSHYTTIPVSLSYDRKLSERTTVGARLSAQTTDWDGPENTRTFTPQITMQTLLTESLSFSGAIGVSFTAYDNGIETSHSTGLSADASLCSTSEFSSFCGRASISQQAATVAGPARTYSLDVDYSRRLDADQTVRLSAGVSRYSSANSVLIGQNFSRSTYMHAAADYSRRLNDRLSGGVNLAARNIAQSGPDPKADVRGSLFIRYRLGDAQ
jgi:hypothetical protein